MPCRRHTSGVFAPASASRKIPIICSSLNRLPFICPSPFSDGLYLQTVGREGGTPPALPVTAQNSSISRIREPDSDLCRAASRHFREMYTERHKALLVQLWICLAETDRPSVQVAAVSQDHGVTLSLHLMLRPVNSSQRRAS